MTIETAQGAVFSYRSERVEPSSCRKPRIVVMGRPGAGKGTQAALLARRLCTQHLSTGALLRHEIEIGSELGLAVERIVSGGRLVPAALVIGIVQANIRGEGYVLDGYPRTLAQAQGLFRSDLFMPDVAIDIDVADDVATARLGARGRSDDAHDVVADRMLAFERETKPAIAVLEREGILHRVDGDDDAESVHRRIWHAVVGSLRMPSSSAPR